MSEEIERVKELAKKARAIETTNPSGAARIRMRIEEMIASFKRKKIFRGAVAARVAPGAGEPPTVTSFAEVERIVRRDVTDALEYVSDYSRRAQLWLLCYYNPELTPQENHENARRAVDGGWDPHDEVV